MDQPLETTPAPAPAPAPTPAPAPAPGPAPAPAPAPTPAPTGLTQEQVDRIIRERLERQTASFEKQLESLGVAGGLAGVEKFLADKAAAEEQRRREAGDYKALYEEAQRKHEALVAEKAAVEKAAAEAAIGQAFRAAATGAVNPEHVAMLANMELNSQQIVIRSLNGTPSLFKGDSPMVDPNGSIMTIKTYVAEWLSRKENAHLRAPATGTGTAPAQTPVPTSVPGKVQSTQDALAALEAARRSGSTAEFKKALAESTHAVQQAQQAARQR